MIRRLRAWLALELEADGLTPAGAFWEMVGALGLVAAVAWLAFVGSAIFG